jgi:hypothetical protein
MSELEKYCRSLSLDRRVGIDASILMMGGLEVERGDGLVRDT